MLILYYLEKFLKDLKKTGLAVNEGKIVDASFIEVPKQRNSREENKQIKNGETPKSLDARWTKKNNISYYGYKNHIKADAKSKLIVKYKVTDALVHDSQVLDNRLNIKDECKDFYGDSADSGKKQQDTISSNKMFNKTCKRKLIKNNPLTEQDKATNKEKSKIRSRVEHIFGFMETSTNGMNLHVIGIKRVEGVVGLMYLTYNMF